MAATSSVRLYFEGNFFKVEKENVKMAMAKPVFSSSWVKRGRFCVMLSATNPGSVDLVNGRKVNGICVGDAPDSGRKTAHGLVLDSDVVDEPSQAYLLGRFVEDRLVYRQTFIIRSYEIGPDKTATMETLMNLLQETALNHVTSSGLAGDGFGATREMSLRKLIWVVTRIHIQVQSYSSWENGMRRDWIIRDYKTQHMITRATSTWVIMNRETRKLSKIPEEVREELLPFYLNRVAIPIEKNDVEKINKLTDGTAERIRSGLAPRWSDMDANQHVNNVKYIGWILESVPMNVLEDYNLTSMTLEYRRECRQSNLLESLTRTTEDSNNNSCNRKADLEYTHLLRMQADKAEIVRARTEWQAKYRNNN
ncbi:hypothetical protein K2173_027570 [Erythroxylum novogranatense]|uniref:Acyl-[acyl-carrier-protein] hydrolase n=1 Tax=Erythroxylum novogranatense TaxID=1862640 RepID=A0AAV8TZQ6_9ROSI|nr:hypothetical protein K2173_027570 [Erythroxylum novogranatense]